MTMGTPRHPGRRIESRKAAEKLLEDEVEHAAGKLKEQLNLIAVIMDTVPDVVVTCNENLEIRTVNSACECVIGYRRDELIGECLTEVVPALADHRKVLASDAFVVSDIEVRLPDGETIAAELRGRRTRLYDKPLIVIVLHDMTERNAAKTMKGEIHKQLHESRRLEAIGALSSGIAHELNTPIQFIGDNVKFIGRSLRKIHDSYKHYDKLRLACQASGALPEEVAEIDAFNALIDLPSLISEILDAMQETVEGVNQVRDIVVLMKEFAHPGTGKPQVDDINVVVKGALTMCRSRTRNVVTVETDLTDGPVPVSCRKAQIQQVVVNLIVNAVEAIEEAGIQGGKILVATKSAGPFLRIEICDNGPGIPEAVMDKIFDPFFTTKSVGKGTGQGLALAKDIIVQQHGGRLFLDDKPGYAACFVIELPCGPSPISEIREAS
jgi:PAS domain S-box-containing protein